MGLSLWSRFTWLLFFVFSLLSPLMILEGRYNTGRWNEKKVIPRCFDNGVPSYVPRRAPAELHLGFRALENFSLKISEMY